MLAGIVLLVAAAIFHAPILRGVAQPLISADGVGDPDYIVLTHCDGVYDEAARLMRENENRQVVVIQWQLSRLEALEIKPSMTETTRHELTERGIAEERIVVLESDALEDWTAYRELGGWLDSAEPAETVLFCNRFSSSRLRHIVGKVTAADASREIRVVGLPDRRYDETNWWKSRGGLKQWFTNWSSYLFTVLLGDRGCFPETWDPDRYEEEISQLMEDSALKPGGGR